jgi:hypothetical protein
MRNANNNLIGKAEGKGHFEDPVVYRRITLRRMLKKTGCDDVDWFHLAQERILRWVLANTVTELRIIKLYSQVYI